MKKLIVTCVILLIGIIIAQAQTVTMSIKGKVTYLDDRRNLLNNAVKVDDAITGTIVYRTDIPDNSTDATVGDYYNKAAPAAMEIKIGTLTFKSDLSNVNLLVEAVCRSSNNGGNAIVFHSYNNVFPGNGKYEEKMISWQLDDFLGKSLNNDSLIRKIDLNKFEQPFGLSITADSAGRMSRYFIRGMITEIVSTVKDVNNTVINEYASILQDDNSPVKVDTTTQSIADYDGNQYKTVKIGEQTWLRENLKSTHYTDGTPIAGASAYDAAIYGRLYTWEAVMHGSPSSIDVPSGVQGVCPVGWHVPSDNEWNMLIKYLGGNSLAGAKMKEKGTELWKAPNEGADNTSFFSVKPGGSLQSGKYYYVGSDAAFWSSSDYNSSKTYARYVFLNNQTTSAVVFNDGNKAASLSVRCVKDIDATPIPGPTPVPEPTPIPVPIPIPDSTSGSNPTVEPVPSPDTISDPNTVPDSIKEPTKDNTVATAINNATDVSSVCVYPNPVSELLFFKGGDQDVDVYIYDLSGNIMISQPLVRNNINVNNLRSGIYVLKLMNKGGVSIRKFVKK